MIRSILVAGCSLVVFGCASASGPANTPIESDEPELSSGFMKVTSCDQGALVIDVKDYPMVPAPGTDPHYKVQAVVRDEGILRYLEGRGALARNPGKKSEAIVAGETWLSSFGGPFAGAFTSTTNTGVDVAVIRHGNAIELRFTSPGSDNQCPSFCVDSTDPSFNPSSGICEGCTRASRPTEVANWWFNNCPVLANIHR